MIDINYSAYRSLVSCDSRVRFLVFHYTAVDFSHSIAALTGDSVSAHYLIPDPTDPSYLAAGYKDVTVFNLLDENERAWHAGLSAWENRTNLNDSSIGVEVVNLAMENAGTFTFPAYAPGQIAAIIALAANIVQRYPTITPTRIVGHSDIAFGRKSDPGPQFPWHAMYLHGIGAWPDESEKQIHVARFMRDGLPQKQHIIDAFHRYGYDANEAISGANYQALVRAFQLHFRPSNFDGNMDVETCGILYALISKYRG